MTDSPTKRRERRKAERPGEILDAAFEEFVANGYAATRLEDVAKRAGVTKGTIYFYFDTKERVFDEMIRHVSRPLFDDLTAFVATLEGPYRARLRALIVYLYGRFGDERASRETLRFLIAEGARFPDLVERHYQEFLQPLVDHLREVVEAGVAAGEFRSSAALRFPEVMLSPSLLLEVWQLLFDKRRPIDVGAFADAHFDLLMNGLAS
ncbi:MAG: TetR/AcrR family transcriptional regulator [Pseudomonadota bacterium]|jgi:AcrR family transcriptional regulator